MAMERAEFETLVTRNEELARRAPAAYRRRVFGLAAVGYLYLGLVVSFLLVLLVLAALSVVYLRAVAIKLLVVTGAPLWMVLRAMWVKLEPPAGLRLTRERVPELFKELDGLRRRLRTPRIRHVLLTPDFNAAVTQIPRLGLLGWHESYLLLGLPLMKALTVEQFRAVLAHELGHLSGGHASSGNRIYRLRRIWQRLDATFTATPHWGSALIRPFFQRYIPYFVATSFPLARANEYAADAASVRLTSARSAAQALTAVNLVGSYLDEKYWPRISAATKDVSQPAFAPFADFSAHAVAEMPATELLKWRETALGIKTSYADTHPSLADRLEAIGAEAEFAPPLQGSDAAKLLGPEASRLEGVLDDQWRQRVADAWRRAHERSQANRSRLTELRTRASQAELDEHASLELAELEEEAGEGSTAALAMLRVLTQRFPDSLPVRFALASQLLRNDDAEGIALMESTIGATVDALLAGAQLLRDYYWRTKETELAQKWHERWVQRANVLQAAQQERSQCRTTDRLVGHELSAEAVARLVQQLESIPELTRVYLARKLTKHLPETPLYVLGFECTKWWRLADKATAHAVQQRIRQEVEFPGETLIANVERANARFAKKFRRVKGSRIL